MKISNCALRLRELTEILGITQADVVKRTGLDKSTVSLYFSGKHVPRQDKISIIADAYSLDPAWLMGYDVPMRHAYLEQEVKELMFDLQKDEQVRKMVRYFLSLNKTQRDSVETILISMLPYSK